MRRQMALQAELAKARGETVEQARERAREAASRVRVVAG